MISHETLAHVYRGGRIESTHSGSIAIVASDGRLLAFAGDPHYATYLRSAAKPFQALPILGQGIVETFDLTPEEVALICASHGGESFHAATAGAILRKGDFDETDLLCGAHEPFESRAASELRQSGDNPSPLHNNCSGKHAGMLLASRSMETTEAQYVDPSHPLQQEIRETVAAFAGVPLEQVEFSIDGCGVPSYYLSLYRTALAYARFSATAWSENDAIEEWNDESRLIFEAMTRHPEYVAGAWSMTTPLMQAFDGSVLAKEGAEAFYAMALRPPFPATLRDLVGPDAMVGVAIKIADGGLFNRARDRVVLRTLALLGYDVEERPALQRYLDTSIATVSGHRIGGLEADFRLSFL